MKSDMDREELEKMLGWYEKRHGPYIEKRGLGNWRNLFRKPTMSEWTILFMMVMALFIAWAYQADTATCRETLENIETTCVNYCEADFMAEQAREDKTDQPGFGDDLNLSLMITADNSIDDG